MPMMYLAALYHAWPTLRGRLDSGFLPTPGMAGSLRECT